MGKFPQFFPFPLTLVTMVVTWGVAVLIHQLNPDLAVATAVIFIILAVFVYFTVTKFILHILNTKTSISGQIKVFGFLDGYFSFLHIFAGIAMAIVVLSNPINQNYTNIPIGTKGYNLFWTYLFSNIVLIFNTAGFGNSGSETALGVLPVLMASITGTIYMIVVLSLVINHLSSKTNTPPPRVSISQHASYRGQYGKRPSRRGNALIMK